MIVNNLSLTGGSSPFKYLCYECTAAVNLNLLYFSSYIVLVFPPSAFIFSLGCRRWKQQRSSSAMSHSDIFTYNMAAVELIGILGGVIGICSIYVNIPEVVFLGLLIASFPWNAQMMFPTLVCVERYLAVVRPITYLRLKQTAGIRIRNIITGVIWVQCTGGFSGFLVYVYFPQFTSIPASVMVLCLITVTFCSLSILCALIRQRPGKGSQDRVKVDKSKRKAFKIIFIIMAVLFFRFGGNLVCFVLSALPGVNQDDWCLMVASGYWFNLPSSLVLPLQFLHRNGKIPRCTGNTKWEILKHVNLSWSKVHYCHCKESFPSVNVYSLLIQHISWL